ncbi:MAG: tetratricopeptide repeat protein [Bacteroidales bacterium]|nr:tetratricopeptide repeat protein [Bacteroidales bacterium]
MKKILFAIMLLFAVLSVSAQKEINQYNPKSLYEKGILLFENKHYASAIDCFEQYISSVDDKKQEDVVMAKYYEAASTLFLDETDGENKITTFIKENPTALVADQAKLLYGNYLFKTRKYRDALKTYSSINSSNLSKEEQDESDFKQAYCYYQTQNVSKATPIFERLAKSEHAYTNDARYYYAHILYINGQEEEALEYFNMLKECSSYSDMANIYILQINFNKNNYADVIENGDDVLKKAHKNRKSDIALMIAESWQQQGDYSKSLEYYNVAMQNSRRKLPREIEFNIGFCKMKSEDYQGAIEHFTKAADKNDELAQYASYYMAQCYSNTDQDKFARNTYLKAYKMNFNDTLKENALYNYAVLSFIPGIDPFNESISVLNEYIKTHPQSSQISELQDIAIHLLLNSNDYSKVLETLEQYEKLSPELKKIQSNITYNVGIQYYNEGKYQDAIRYFEKSSNNKDIESNSQKEAIYWLADSYYQLKNYNEAEDTYIRFIDTKGANNLEVYALAHYNLGYIYLNNNDYANASIKFKEFINNDKLSDKERQGDAWTRIGDCYFIQRQYNNAITSYNNSLKISNKNADYIYFQQAMGYGALGKSKEKINSLNTLVVRHQKSVYYDRAIYEMGMAQLNSNDNKSAITSFNKVIKERPRSQYARKSLMKIGMIYYNNDENDKALESLKTIVAQYPNTEESREALNIISSIYRDNNEIQLYFDYIAENNLAEISIDKQDSLTFRNIEDFYSSKKYQQVIKGAKQYIEKHPNGAYLLDVHYYAMNSMEMTNETEGIRTHIEYIINQNDNDYTDQALLLIARMEYDESSYSNSAKYYERLLNITENQQVITEATEGSMKSYYFDEQYDKAIEKANQLMRMQDVNENQKKQANYILGKSYFDKKGYSEALKYFEIYSDVDNTETGAECAYLSAVCLYNTQRYDEAEEKVFFVSDKFSNYINWTARSFIILSDVYVAKDNIFQAKETLKSVIENYPDDEADYTEVIDLAQEKLDLIENTSNE